MVGCLHTLPCWRKFFCHQSLVSDSLLPPVPFHISSNSSHNLIPRFLAGFDGFFFHLPSLSTLLSFINSFCNVHFPFLLFLCLLKVTPINTNSDTFSSHSLLSIESHFLLGLKKHLIMLLTSMLGLTCIVKNSKPLKQNYIGKVLIFLNIFTMLTRGSLFLLCFHTGQIVQHCEAEAK